MAEPTFSRASIDADDDLPRTLRRERDAQARRARAHELQDTLGQPIGGDVNADVAKVFPGELYNDDGEYAAPATVTRLQVPFLHLMLFFLKAVVAAIPALILLLVILWGFGEILKATFPELVKLQILIRMPN